MLGMVWSIKFSWLNIFIIQYIGIL